MDWRRSGLESAQEFNEKELGRTYLFGGLAPVALVLLATESHSLVPRGGWTGFVLGREGGGAGGRDEFEW